MAAKELRGIVFEKNASGERSSTDVNKRVMKAANSVFNNAALVDGIEAERAWRFRYTRYFEQNVRNSLASPELALESARAGLDALYTHMTFLENGVDVPLREAMAREGTVFHTTVVQGRQRPVEFAMPYKGRTLRGEELRAQLSRWVRYGTIEQSAGDAIAAAIDGGYDLKRFVFVLLGAGAAMGPYNTLMALGATVVAIDINIAPIWERLIATARNSAGTLIVPTSAEVPADAEDKAIAAVAGVNLMEQTPQVANWIASACQGRETVVGCYVYLDGEMHVRVSLACDAIMEKLCKSPLPKSVALAYLCTPTDIHVIPEEAHRAARANYSSLSPANVLLRFLSLFSFALGSRPFLQNNALRPEVNRNGERFYLADGLVVPQGPNYAIAKRLQHWRAIIARSEGHRVASNVAPSTATASVLKNKNFARAYDGMPFVKPYEIFAQDTSNTVMTALLLFDLFDDKSVANPKVPLRNPLELFSLGSMHGGVWRAGYKTGSIGEVSVLIHFAKVLRLIYVVPALVFLLFILRLR